MKTRVVILETFLIISKHISLRPVFLRESILHQLMAFAMNIVQEQTNHKPSRDAQISLNTAKLLCNLSTVKTTRYYIPGETNTAERLRKYAFDCGIFTLLNYLYTNLTKDKQPFRELREYIKTKVLNLVELNDLHYHSTVLKAINTKPLKTESIITKAEDD